MTNNQDTTIDEIGQYYSDLLEKHGTKAEGVGWTDEQRHLIRFNELLKLLPSDNSTPITINDLGCGYGALFNFLVSHEIKIQHFYAYDISKKMLDAAQDNIPPGKATFLREPKLLTHADFSFASGIFNVRFKESDKVWQEYIIESLHNLNDFSSKGFAFNLLSSYVDWKDNNLYYADPRFFFDYCKTNFSRKVSLLHDTPLYEWTMIIRK